MTKDNTMNTELMHEQAYIEMEAARIDFAEKYFKARPQIDNNDRRKVFESGFDRGYQAALNSQAKSVPDGYALVPIEPTQEMCQQGQIKAREWPTFPLRILPIYQAMLAAAPQPAQSIEADRVRELECEWKPINEANFTDDLIWLFDGVDSIEGPRTLEHDDYDKYPYFAECTWPSTSTIASMNTNGKG